MLWAIESDGSTVYSWALFLKANWVGGYFFRNADNPNETIFLLEWDNLANARRFAGDPSVQNVLMQAGLIDQPDIFFLEEVARPYC